MTENQPVEPDSQSSNVKYSPLDQLDSGMVARIGRNDLGTDAARRMDSSKPLAPGDPLRDNEPQNSIPTRSLQVEKSADSTEADRDLAA